MSTTITPRLPGYNQPPKGDSHYACPSIQDFASVKQDQTPPTALQPVRQHYPQAGGRVEGNFGVERTFHSTSPPAASPNTIRQKR